MLDDCLDHCLLLEPEEQPKKKTLLQEIHQGIAVRPPTLLPEVRPAALPPANRRVGNALRSHALLGGMLPTLRALAAGEEIDALCLQEKATKEDADKVVLAIKGPGGPNDGLNFTSKPKKTKKVNATNIAAAG